MYRKNGLNKLNTRNNCYETKSSVNKHRRIWMISKSCLTNSSLVVGTQTPLLFTSELPYSRMCSQHCGSHFVFACWLNHSSVLISSPSLRDIIFYILTNKTKLFIPSWTQLYHTTVIPYDFNWDLEAPAINMHFIHFQVKIVNFYNRYIKRNIAIILGY